MGNSRDELNTTRSILEALLTTERVARRMGDEALDRRVTALEGAIDVVDQIDGQNLRRAQLAERRLEEAKKEVETLRTQVRNLREAATVASSWVEKEDHERVKRQLGTMTDYAKRLKKERDMVRGDLIREKNHHAVTSSNLQDAKDTYVNVAEERDMARHSVEVLEAQRDSLMEALAEEKDKLLALRKAVEYLESLAKALFRSSAFTRGYGQGLERAIREIRQIV